MPNNSNYDLSFQPNTYWDLRDVLTHVEARVTGKVRKELVKHALQNGEIAAAGLDVLEKEPPELDNPLLNMENVIITPHAASGTSRMRPASRRRVGNEIVLALSGKWPMSVVNPSIMPKVPMERWQPYPMGRGPNR